MKIMKTGFIQVLDDKMKTRDDIEILYYPPEYSMEKSNTFAEISIPGLDAPYIQFIKGNAGSVTLEAFYDTYEKGTDVREYVNKLTDLMKIDPDLHAPPPLLFHWGMESANPFYCVLERVSRRFTMFREDGIPVRARISITLKEFKKGLSEGERTLQSPDKTKIYTVIEGDSLWRIAYALYGDPLLWRPIAARNKIENPRFLRAGDELIIPSLE